MTGVPEGPQNGLISFGSFRLAARERLLLMNGQPVPLGSRALDLLVALIGDAPHPVEKRVLMARIWRDVVVDEGNLRVQVTALRKSLGDAEGGARYIVTVPGRGYAFVGEIKQAVTPGATLDAPRPSYGLPGRLEHVFGRGDALQVIAARLLAERFVSIVGPGGIGKTTVATWLGHELLQDFAEQVCMVDLGTVGDPGLVGAAVASALGVTVSAAAMTPAIIAFLRQRRLLLIFDSCEHVIDSVAALAEHIYREAPGVYILTTSREELRVDGERICRLAALDTPPEGKTPGAAAALASPAVQLFVARVTASDSSFGLSDEEAPVVASICRSLDGIPLAIELAASRIATYGVAETARLLNGSFPLAWRGRRTAPPRHQTLAATLDWSYALLLEPERLLLRRLAVFVGSFDMAAAKGVAIDDVLDEQLLLDSIAGLAAKSLLTVKPGARKSYRLLDTTRAYAFQKCQAGGELAEVAQRHARHFCHLLSCEKDAMVEPGPAGAAAAQDVVGNVRAALEWCYGKAGDAAVGVGLAAAAAPLLLRLSLLTECIRWMDLALAALDGGMRGTALEMELQASLGVSLMFTNGNSERVINAFERSRTIAEGVGALEHQVRLLGWLNVVHLRMGRIRDALVYAKQGADTAQRLGDAYVIAATEGFLGSSYNLLGRNREAEASLTAALSHVVPSSSPVRLGFSTRNHALTSLALTLWVLGQSERAIAIALESVEEAVRLGHPSTLCIALLYSISVFLWAGELDRAEAYVEHFVAEAERYSLTPYVIAGTGIRGEIAIRRGQAEAGVPMLLASLDALRRERYQRRMTIFCGALAEGFMAVGRHDEAWATINDAILRSRKDGELVALPELLRIKGHISAHLPSVEAQANEALLLQSISCARSQEALSWELRGAMSLAAVWSSQGRSVEAAALLGEVYGRFTEGFAMTDLRAARLLMDELEHRIASCKAHATGVET